MNMRGFVICLYIVIRKETEIYKSKKKNLSIGFDANFCILKSVRKADMGLPDAEQEVRRGEDTPGWGFRSHTEYAFQIQKAQPLRRLRSGTGGC